MVEKELKELAVALVQISKDEEALTAVNDMLSNTVKDKIMSLSYTLLVKKIDADVIKKEEN